MKIKKERKCTNIERELENEGARNKLKPQRNNAHQILFLKTVEEEDESEREMNNHVCC